MKKIELIVLFIFFSNLLYANVRLNSLFTDGAVYQRQVPLPVYGTATPGEVIKLIFNNQMAKTKADKNGNWRVLLKPMEAGGPYIMTVQGQNNIEVKDLYLGEVWVCSGQSNMERQLGPRGGQKLIDNWETERDAANYPLIREYKVPWLSDKEKPLSDIESRWIICSPQTVVNFSAVGYFFGSELYKKLNVPIGLIHTAAGGTCIEGWTSPETIENNPLYSQYLQKYGDAKAKVDSAMNAYKLSGATGKRPNGIHYSLTSLYNGMVVPLFDYPIKGVIWYQGESNNGRWKSYAEMTKIMVKEWRKHWNMGDFPFLYVQLAPYKGMGVEIKEAQRLALAEIPNSAMVITTDCGDSLDIHPTNKRPVGERLSLAARALAYGEKIVYSGPQISKVVYQGRKAILSFTFMGNGLIAKDGDLRGFEMAGKDMMFYPAKAFINGDKIELHSPLVEQPQAVRFGWKKNPNVNLYNEEGLPAVPFTTEKIM